MNYTQDWKYLYKQILCELGVLARKNQDLESKVFVNEELADSWKKAHDEQKRRADEWVKMNKDLNNRYVTLILNLEKRGLLSASLRELCLVSESEGSPKTDQHKQNVCVSQKPDMCCEFDTPFCPSQLNLEKFNICKRLFTDIIYKRDFDPYSIHKINKLIDFLNGELEYQEKCLERDSRLAPGLGVETEENEGDEEEDEEEDEEDKIENRMHCHYGPCNKSEEKVEKVRKVYFIQGKSVFVKKELETFFAYHDYDFALPVVHYDYSESENEECVMVEYFVKKVS